MAGLLGSQGQRSRSPNKTSFEKSYECVVLSGYHLYIFLEIKKKVKMLTGRQMDISWSYLCNLTKNETLHIDKTITYQIYMYTYQGLNTHGICFFIQQH